MYSISLSIHTYYDIFNQLLTSSHTYANVSTCKTCVMPQGNIPFYKAIFILNIAVSINVDVIMFHNNTLPIGQFIGNSALFNLLFSLFCNCRPHH